MPWPPLPRARTSSALSHVGTAVVTRQNGRLVGHGQARSPLRAELLQHLWRKPVPVLRRSRNWHGDWNQSLLSILPVWAVRKHYAQLCKWTGLQHAIPTDVPLLNCGFYSCRCNRLCTTIWRAIVTCSEYSSPSREAPSLKPVYVC